MRQNLGGDNRPIIPLSLLLWHPCSCVCVTRMCNTYFKLRKALSKYLLLLLEIVGFSRLNILKIKKII